MAKDLQNINIKVNSIIKERKREKKVGEILLAFSITYIIGLSLIILL